MLAKRGSLSYLLLIFFNAFVDLGHKILLQDTLYQTASAAQYSVLSSVINALMLLPFIFLFTPSGFIADRYAKVQVMRVTALAAVPLLLMVTWSYYQGYFYFSFVLTLLLATQSALGSPAKYGYIKEMFGKANIARANAWVQTTAVLAILSGSYVFSVVFARYVDPALQDRAVILHTFAPAGWVLLLMTVAETLCAFHLPLKPAAHPSGRFTLKQYLRGRYLRQYVRLAVKTPIIFFCIIGLACYGGVNQVLLASYGAYLKMYAGNPSVAFVQGGLAIAGLGVLIGAGYAGRVSSGFIETGLIPFGAIGVTVGLFFLMHLVNLHSILVCFFLYGVAGGMLVVPLNALIQFNAKETELGKVIASTNFFQYLLMLFMLVVNVIYSAWVSDIRYLYYGLVCLTAFCTVYAIIKMPQSLIRYILYFFVSRFFRVRVNGLDSIPSTGGVLLLGNHSSFADWALIQISCPRPVRFVIDRSYYEKPVFNWILKLQNVIPIASRGSKAALKSINDALLSGDVVCLFPEGRLSLNGQLNEFKTGFERAVRDTGAQVVPFYLLGLWGTAISHASRRYKRITQRRRRRISVSFGQPFPDSVSSVTIKQQVMQMSIIGWKNHIAQSGTLVEEWLSRVQQFPREDALIDSSGGALSQTKLLSTVLYVREKIKKATAEQDNIGILLPCSAPGVITNLSVLCLDKTVVNLNYTMPLANLAAAIAAAQVKTIVTSRRFLTQLKKKGYELGEVLSTVNLMYVEDYHTPTTKLAVLINFICVKVLPNWMLKLLFFRRADNSKTAAILFSSGSEASPKGIELSHRNIVGNAKQISSVYDIREDDVVLGTLPLFHAFGLTGSVMMPLIEGIPIVCHPDPTDVVGISKLVYSQRVTVMCGTSTLFGLYVRHPRVYAEMLASLRLVIAGAEKLSDSTRQAFKAKFSHDVYEGYGATEVAPVASTNLPNQLNASDWHLQLANKPGTVGLPLPGTAFSIVDPPLPIGEAGMVLIGGTQVMKGYLNDVATTRRVLIPDGEITWYVSGDKGYIDEDGYLTIVDRYSRFVKVAGEMISLSAVETAVMTLLADSGIEVMALSQPDEKRGEQVVMLYTGDLSPDALQRLLRQLDNPLLIPAACYPVAELPRLGSGKKDYLAAKQVLSTLISS